MKTSQPFLPALEGLRAVACCGIIITHVAFQTGNDTGSVINRMMARTDFFVPVFFALSGFLLWRRHHGDVGAWTWLGYYVKRVGRIMPACWALVLAVLLIFPVAGESGWAAILANLTLAQIYVPHGLVGGLTHLWSLCVEMAFYLVLPALALIFGRRPAGLRIALIALIGFLSFGWAFLPWFATAPGAGELNPHVMPPAFTAWFGVGILAAEFEKLKYAGVLRADRLEFVFGRLRLVWWLLALGALFVAAHDGPEGLTHATPSEFARRTLYGLVFAFALIVPYALAPASKWLESTWMQTLGRWSYSIFLWHMAILSLVFPLLGIQLFSGYTVVVLIATFLLTVPVAALSYAVVEEPARKAINSWWRSVRAGG